MLEFAPLGLHGRVVLLLLLAAAAGDAQSTSTFDDLIPELVARIASAVPPETQVALAVTTNDDPAATVTLQMRLAAQLAARGVRVGNASAPATVAVGCGRNLRERVCVAQIRSGDRDQLATVTRPFELSSLESRGTLLALELRPVVSQGVQMLDIAATGDRLLVLDVNAVTLFEQKDGAWREIQSRALPLSRVWPRDPRGLVRVESGHFEIFVPGGSCAGRSDSLEMSCADGDQPWPIGAANRGLEPGRNYFRASDGGIFYNAAPLGAAVNDDAIELTTHCTAGTYVVGVSRNASDGRDVLQLSRVTDGRLVQTASPVVLNGVLTALWPQADKTSAVVITHDVTAGRYDAFHAVISCSH